MLGRRNPLSVLAGALLPAVFAAGTAMGQQPDPISREIERIAPRVEALEERESISTLEELAGLRAEATDLRRLVETAEAAAPGTAGSPPRVVRKGRRLLQRIDALDLERQAVELDRLIHSLEPQAASLTKEEVDKIRRDARELMTGILALEQAAKSNDAVKAGVSKAEKAVAESRSVELLADAEDKKDRIEDLASSGEQPTDEEVEEIGEAAEELKANIEQVQAAGEKTELSELVGLERARRILVELLAEDVHYTALRMWSEVERLEALDEPPSPAELRSGDAAVADLRDKVGVLESTLEGEPGEKIRPYLGEGLGLLRRWGRLVLQRTVADLEPEVAAFEARSDELTDADIRKLRSIPPEVRPQIREAQGRGAAKDPPETDPTPEVATARSLLKRIETLVPDSAASVEEPRDAPDTQPVARVFRFYGSLRARLLYTADGLAVDGQTSRIGVRASKFFFPKIGGFGRAEIGFNLKDVSDRLFSGDDPGSSNAFGSSLLEGRLFFVGLEYKLGELSFGKQWSAYYDVAVFTDQMPFLAGAGTVVYNAGTDGGVSGTGRASQALQSRNAFGSYRVNGQIQIRNDTDNDQAVADTWGVSLRREWNQRFWVGLAYNEVRDGVPDPEIGQQPKEDDRAFIAGFRYKTERLYAAATLATFNNHEIDDQGRFFSGLGVELYTDWQWTEKLLLRGALSWVRPRDHPGKFETLSVTPALRYTLTKRIGLHFTARIDASTQSDGSERGADTVAASIFYGF